MANLYTPYNRRPEQARLNRFLRIPMITAAMIKAALGGNVCKINDVFPLFHFEDDLNKYQLFKLKMKMVYYRFAYEYIYNEIFLLDFDNHTKKENLKNVSTYEYLRVMREIISNQDPEIIETFRDKRKTYRKFSKYFKRDVVIIEKPEDYREFSDFIAKHKKFVVKTAREDNGKGIKFFDLEKDNISPKEIFNNALKDGALVEEIIKQAGLLNDINPSSVNTIRFVTFFNEGKQTKVACGLRMGRTGEKLDNMARGGLSVGIDPESGIIFSKGQRKFCKQRFERHPDSNIKFVGTQIPHWDELLETVEEIVRVYPEKHFVGWDFAYSDKGWCITEANGTPGNDLTSTVAKEGLRPLYSKTLFTLVKDCEKYQKAIY